MKRMKKFVSVVLAMMMVLGMGITAFAADNNPWTIKINKNEDDTADHVYEAYQIFKGNLSNGKLSNIEWGSGIDETKISDALAALKADDTFLETKADGTKVNKFAECESAADVALVLGTFENSDKSTAKEIDAFATIISSALSTVHTDSAVGGDTISVIGSGYYMVKDKDGSLTVSDNDAAYTRLLLQVVGNAQVNVKSEVPDGDKQVYYAGADALDRIHTHSVEAGCYDADGNLICQQDEFTYDPSHNRGDANNAGIGDHVTFEITSKVPNYVGYDYYYFIMNDTMSDGLTFDGASTVTVKIGDQTLTQGTKSVLICSNTENGHVHDSECYNMDGDYYVYPNGDHSFRLTFKDIMEKNDDGSQKWAVDAPVVVTYSALVNNAAVIGTSGNKNTWSLEYSRDPNVEYRPGVDWENPGLPLDEDNTVLGKTPDKITLTYVTELDITKYADEIDETDLTKNVLAGAEFTLTGTSYQVVTNTVKYYTEDANGTFYKLLDGTYTTTAPTGTTYVEIGVGTATTTTGYIMDADGNYVVPANKEAYVGATLYKLVRGTNDKYADVNVKYVEKEATETEMVPVDVAIELTTDDKGKISFRGLGAGEYTLTETVTPAGYNTIEPIHFTINWTKPDGNVTDGNEKCTWTITWDGAIDTGLDEDGNGTPTGIFAANVINVSGLLLPSTGGIGTTIFYVTGSILVLAAVVLLVTKKRMVREK